MIIIAVSPLTTKATEIAIANNDKRIVFTGADVNSVAGIETWVVSAKEDWGIELSDRVTIGDDIDENWGATADKSVSI
jgi:hypothetical protein